MINFKNVIFYSTLISIFTEALTYHVGFDLKFFYLIIFVNTIVLLIFKRIIYSKGLIIFHSIILFNGLLTCLFGYNGIGYFLVQLFFLFLIPTYYLSFYSLFKDRFNNIIEFYCKSCVVIAVIGLIKFPLDVLNNDGLHSIMLEPAHYCTIVLPALYITFQIKSYPRYFFIVILLSIILSGSSLGFMGIGLGVVLYARKISLVKIIIASSFVILLGLAIYNYHLSFKIRLDDTFNGIVDKDLSKSNLSTYALLSNYFVAYQSFISNPLIGNGIGSHVISRALYLQNVTGIEVFEKMNIDHLNAQDAASLFLRLMSETGLLGLFGVFYFIKRFYVTNPNTHTEASIIICRGILLYFFCKLFREGHYFSPEMYFFVFAYYYNFTQGKLLKRTLINLSPR